MSNIVPTNLKRYIARRLNVALLRGMEKLNSYVKVRVILLMIPKRNEIIIKAERIIAYLSDTYLPLTRLAYYNLLFIKGAL